MHGEPRGSWLALAIAFAVVMMLLAALNLLSVHIVPNVWWYVFCGFCLALSVIMPGMSFSTGSVKDFSQNGLQPLV